MAFDHILKSRSKAVSVHKGLDVWDGVFFNKYVPASSLHPHLLLLLSRKHELSSGSYMQSS